MGATSYEKVRGGKFSSRAEAISVKSEKKRKKEKKKAWLLAAAMEAARKEGVVVGQGIGGDPGGDAKGTYEELFPYEVKRQQEGKGRTQCWAQLQSRAGSTRVHGELEEQEVRDVGGGAPGRGAAASGQVLQVTRVPADRRG